MTQEIKDKLNSLPLFDINSTEAFYLLIERLKVDHRIANDTSYPVCEACYVNVQDFEEKTGNSWAAIVSSELFSLMNKMYGPPISLL